MILSTGRAQAADSAGFRFGTDTILGFEVVCARAEPVHFLPLCCGLFLKARPRCHGSGCKAAQGPPQKPAEVIIIMISAALR
jgi:hypothetical protein